MTCGHSYAGAKHTPVSHPKNEMGLLRKTWGTVCEACLKKLGESGLVQRAISHQGDWLYFWRDSFAMTIGTAILLGQGE